MTWAGVLSLRPLRGLRVLCLTRYSAVFSWRGWSASNRRSAWQSMHRSCGARLQRRRTTRIPGVLGYILQVDDAAVIEEPAALPPEPGAGVGGGPGASLQRSSKQCRRACRVESGAGWRGGLAADLINAGEDMTPHGSPAALAGAQAGALAVG